MGNFLQDSSSIKRSIWRKSILFLKKSESFIGNITEKLIKSGLYEEDALAERDQFDEDYFSEEEQFLLEELKRNFVKSRNILVIQNKFNTVSRFAEILMSVGFKNSNIYGEIDTKLLGKYFRDLQPNYLIMEYDLYRNNHLYIIEKFVDLEKVNIFLTVTRENIQADKEGKIAEIAESGLIRIIKKPISIKNLKYIMNQYVNTDFERFVSNKNDGMHSEEEDFAAAMSA